MPVNGTSLSVPREVYAHKEAGYEIWAWSHFSAVQRGEWNWVNFSPSEMRCRKTGRLAISPEFMDIVQDIRSITGIPMAVTSGYRSPEHNAASSHTKRLDGPHPDAQAIDIAASRTDAFEIQKAAMMKGFKGIGLKQHGDRRYLHLDAWWKRTGGTLWTYYEP